MNRSDQVHIEIETFEDLYRLLYEHSTVPENIARTGAYLVLCQVFGWLFDIRCLLFSKEITPINLRQKHKNIIGWYLRTCHKPTLWISYHSPPGTGRTTFVEKILMPTIDSFLLNMLNSKQEYFINNLNSLKEHILSILEGYNNKKRLSELDMSIVSSKLFDYFYVKMLERVLKGDEYDIDIIVDEISSRVPNLLKIAEEVALRVKQAESTSLIDLVSIDLASCTRSGFMDRLARISYITRSMMTCPYTMIIGIEAGRMFEASRRIDYMLGTFQDLTRIYDQQGKIEQLSEKSHSLLHSIRMIPRGIFSCAVFESQKPEIYINDYQLEQGIARRILWIYAYGGRSNYKLRDVFEEFERDTFMNNPLINILKKYEKLITTCIEYFTEKSLPIYLQITDQELADRIIRLATTIHDMYYGREDYLSIYKMSSYFTIFTRLLFIQLLHEELTFTIDDIMPFPIAIVERGVDAFERAKKDFEEFMNSAEQVLNRIIIRPIREKYSEYDALINKIVEIVHRSKSGITLRQLLMRLKSKYGYDIVLKCIAHSVASGNIVVMLLQDTRRHGHSSRVKLLFPDLCSVLEYLNKLENIERYCCKIYYGVSGAEELETDLRNYMNVVLYPAKTVKSNLSEFME